MITWTNAQLMEYTSMVSMTQPCMVKIVVCITCNIET